MYTKFNHHSLVNYFVYNLVFLSLRISDSSVSPAFERVNYPSHLIYNLQKTSAFYIVRSLSLYRLLISIFVKAPPCTMMLYIFNLIDIFLLRILDQP